MAVLHKTRWAEYEQAMSLTKKEREEQGMDGIPEEPVQKKFVISDITPECLAFVHDGNKRGICLYADELASWFKNFNRYSKGSEEQFWLSVFSGKPIIFDRKGMKRSISIKHSFISVIGTIQQGILKELAKGDRNQNGFLDRILFVLPENLNKQYWNKKELDTHISRDWQKITQKLIDMAYSVDESGNPISKEIRFESTAMRLLMEWQHENTDLCNQELDEQLGGIYSKLEIYAIRFCLILQIIRWTCGESSLDFIDETSVRGAIELIAYFRKTAQRVQGIIHESYSLEGIPTDNIKLYRALPDDFETAEGIEVAANFGMSPDSFKRFLKDNKEKLFENYKHGKYRKIILL
ncbi:hypothetical protein EZS27_006277 [termite gut metagenome]|uniref:DUF3987 domain-containing protein n=1 Tax=termite gut metagenome TaxID=433724 RepID=A0A5J4SJB0_9ZZZZ